MITVYTIAYNEQFMLPFFIKHYRTMFPDCHIVVYDNESTDRTVEIAQENNCEVITYKTDNKLSDQAYLDIKNKCWWNSQTPWVLIADVDEHCFIDHRQLKEEEKNGISVINFAGYNMVSHIDDIRNVNVPSISFGIREKSYDKIYLFDSEAVLNIEYNPGAHTAILEGRIICSNEIYKCKHYKYITIDYMITRHATFASRLSEDNLKKGYGGHYLYTPEQIKNEFEQARKKSYVIH